MKLPSFWQYLPKEIQTRFSQKQWGRQRAMVAQGHLLLVLHRIPQPGNREREERLFWRKPDGSWDSTQGSGLLRLMEHVEEYELAEAALGQKYGLARDSEDYFEILEQTSPLLHAAKNLHATLQAAREGIPHDHDLIDLRDRAYEVERTLDLLYMDARHARDFKIAKQSEEEARLSLQSVKIANRLNVLVAIFLPLTALAGIFGMNLHSGLDEGATWTFWVVLVAGVSLGFAMSWWALRGVPIRKAQEGKVKSRILSREPAQR